MSKPLRAQLCLNSQNVFNKKKHTFELSKEDLDSYRRSMELRCLIEGFASRVAANRVRNDADKSRLLDAYSHMAAAIKHPDSNVFHRADESIHREILLLSNIPGVLPAWEAVYSSIDWFRKLTVFEFWPDIEMLLEAHRYLVDAICQGKPDIAQEAAERHTMPVWKRINALLKSESKIYMENDLDRILAYIDFHIDENITIDTLITEVVELSAGHIRRLFREQLHTTFTKYLRTSRMKHAAKLLLETNLPVYRIRKMVACSDASEFSLHFRKQYGTTPSQYRRAADNKKL
ncbi:MAG: helix-turn-helix domain-containing protein [Planctomycetia bacterium]|nr:helix-turn-helix domain-containing protein [Planctomycetia bacterium]